MFLFKVFQFDKFEGEELFKILPEKHPNNAFLVPNLCSFVFLQNFDKFEGADFKYGNNYFQTLPQKYPNKTLPVRNLGIFVFTEKFGNKQI